MKVILALTISALLALVRAAQPAPVVTPTPPSDSAPVASSTATVAVPPDDAPPCPITYIDPWGRWHCGVAGVVPPAIDLEANPYPGPCVTAGMWQGRAVCDDTAPEGYPAP